MGGLKDGLGGGTGDSTYRDEISNDVIITGTNRLYFRDSGISIYSSADGKLRIESDGAGTDDIDISGAVTVTGAASIVGATSMTGDVEMNLASKDGTNQLTLKDVDGFSVAKIDSAGNMKVKGKYTKV